jgi:anti-anti-sigma factor
MHLPPHPDGGVDDRSDEIQVPAPAPVGPQGSRGHYGGVLNGGPTRGCPPLVVTAHGRILRVAGELDMATAPVLEECVADFDGSIRLDLEALTFIDSAGIAAFIRLFRRCESDGCSFRIENCCPQVERTLRISGVYETLTGGPR